MRDDHAIETGSTSSPLKKRRTTSIQSNVREDPMEIDEDKEKLYKNKVIEAEKNKKKVEEQKLDQINRNKRNKHKVLKDKKKQKKTSLTDKIQKPKRHS